MSKQQTAQNGKGSKPIYLNDKKSYDACPLWDYIEKKRAKENEVNGKTSK